MLIPTAYSKILQYSLFNVIFLVAAVRKGAAHRITAILIVEEQITAVRGARRTAARTVIVNKRIRVEEELPVYPVQV